MKHLALIALLALSACNYEVETDVQISPYLCMDGWQYEYSESCLSGLGCNARTDDYGAHLTCTP